jgi:hypothetical protein
MGSDVSLPTAWEGAPSNIKIDHFEFWSLLEALDKKNHRRIEERDRFDAVPKTLQEIHDEWRYGF